MKDSNLQKTIEELRGLRLFLIESFPRDLVKDILRSKFDMTPCLSNCSNNGKCELNSDKFTCSCFDNYTGENCNQFRNPCMYFPCMNNGTCIHFSNQNSSDLTKKFKCECSNLYHGLNCENKIDICKNEICSGNGVCFDNSSIPTCKCVLYYLGEKCEIQSKTLNNLKTTRITSAAIAFILIILFYLQFVVRDMLDHFLAKNRNKKVIEKRNREMAYKSRERFVNFVKPKYIP